MTDALIHSVVEQVAARRAEQLELFILAHLRETGRSIEELELVEETRGNQIVWHIRKRTQQ